jgi:integrin-linked kinase-associated serine/threonine phosphatase 2C
VKKTFPRHFATVLYERFKSDPCLKPDTVKSALKTAFSAMDAHLKEKDVPDGAVFTCILLLNRHAYIANLGDAKVVLCRSLSSPPAASITTGCPIKLHDHPCNCESSGLAFKFLALTKDHKPLLLAEKKRIERAGGHIVDGRVSGALEVARSFGDLEFKNGGVISEPDVRIHFKLTDAEEFVLLGCDGLWSRFPIQEAIAFVRHRLYAGPSDYYYALR